MTQPDNDSAELPQRRDDTPDTPSEDRRAADDAANEAITRAPFVVVNLSTSGIHPSTSRVIAVDAVTLTAKGDPVDTFHAVVNPESDPGPFHLHGRSRDEIEQGKRFGQILKQLDTLIDGRTLIVHNTPRTWGFIVAESRRAMNTAARANRSRGRNNRRGGRGRRRQRVGHVPQPVQIVDTLGSARRQGIVLNDVRVRGVAHSLGIDAPTATASVERAKSDARELAREDTLLISALYSHLRSGELAAATPESLRADRFGLQRSHVRVDAQEASRPWVNPGVYKPGSSLIQGMEVVVAPEIEMDPDVIIAAAYEKELAYSEKLTRQTSVVVCNQTRDIDGKAMHAQRKGIPLLSDVAFLEAVQRVKPGTPAEDS